MYALIELKNAPTENVANSLFRVDRLAMSLLIQTTWPKSLSVKAPVIFVV